MLFVCCLLKALANKIISENSFKTGSLTQFTYTILRTQKSAKLQSAAAAVGTATENDHANKTPTAKRRIIKKDDEHNNSD